MYIMVFDGWCLELSGMTAMHKLVTKLVMVVLRTSVHLYYAFELRTVQLLTKT